MAISPLNAPGSIVTFGITSGGSPIPDSIAVISVTVQKRLNQASSAQLVLHGGDADMSTFAISSSNIFIPGNEIAVSAGYDGQNSPLFSGKVMSQTIRITGDGASTLTVECRNDAVDTRVFDNSPVITLQYGDDILEFDAKFSRPANAFKVHGTVKFRGTSLAEPGKYISLAGLGDRFNGDHLVSAAAHRIEDGNWTTEATIGLAD